MNLTHQGALFRRPFNGKWEALAPDIEAAVERFGLFQECCVDAANDGDPVTLRTAVSSLIATARLPVSLSNQVLADACSIASAVGRMCRWAPELTIKLEITGENACHRWHQDRYGGRAIVSYTGRGTEYTSDSNVDFWELRNCGNNKCIIRDESKTFNVDVGTFCL